MLGKPQEFPFLVSSPTIKSADNGVTQVTKLPLKTKAKMHFDDKLEIDGL